MSNKLDHHPTKTDAELLLEKDLDPDKWHLVGVTYNTWGSLDGDPKTSYEQTKLVAHKLPDPEEVVVPARTDGIKFKRPTVKVSRRDPRLVVFVGDQHAPFHDVRLHELFLKWLDEYQPNLIVLMGDGADYPTISRHVNKPEHTARVQECVDGQYRLYRDYREHAPKAQIRKLAGNHEIRIATVLLNEHNDLYGISQAADGNDAAREPVLSLVHLLRLDELAIELVEDTTKSNYENARVVVTDELVARHGTKAVRRSGASALKTMDDLDHSIVVGHSHRQALVPKTIHTADGPKVLWACETGAMCNLDVAKSYAVDAQWQQGFATAVIWSDDTFTLELASYKNKQLNYRGQRWE